VPLLVTLLFQDLCFDNTNAFKYGGLRAYSYCNGIANINFSDAPSFLCEATLDLHSVFESSDIPSFESHRSPLSPVEHTKHVI